MEFKIIKNIFMSLLLFILSLAFTTSVQADKSPVLSTPNVPFKHALGMKKYQKNCASCHGKWIEGTKNGPPLLHGFYKPSHHGDPAFYRAALKGVRAHHWEFGDMPKIDGITVRDMDRIIPFIRWLQQERGLY